MEAKPEASCEIRESRREKSIVQMLSGHPSERECDQGAGEKVAGDLPEGCFLGPEGGTEASLEGSKSKSRLLS